VATKPEAVKSEAVKPDAAKPAKSKKFLLIGGILFVVLALAGGGAWFFISKKNAAAAEDGSIEEVVHAAPKGPPTFLPLDNMVVNLADPGGEKVAQIGITLELADAHATDKVKVYLPSIRSSILLLISQRTAEELLQLEGKEKLAADILVEASRPFDGADAGHAATKQVKEGAKAKKKSADRNAISDNPVRGVYFSSFIVQ
jgi:flagellar FliL protein